MSGCHPPYNHPRYAPKSIEKEVLTMTSWGLHTSVDLYNCDPLTIRDPEKIREYVEELCNIIEMKRFGDCQVVHFGEDEKVAGFSMVQLIETSLISGHFANATNNAYLDIFSCKLYNPATVVEFSRQFFLASDFILAINERK